MIGKSSLEFVNTAIFSHYSRFDYIYMEIVMQKFCALFLLALAGFSGITVASPVTTKDTVYSVRLIPGSDIGYVALTKEVGTCTTNTFSFKTDTPSGLAMYAALLKATTSSRQVELEVETSVGCTGWGTKLMGVTVY